MNMNINTITDYFEVYYDKADETFAQTLARKADIIYEDLNCKFGFGNLFREQKIILTICESVSKYLKVTNKTADEYEEWMVGNCDFENRKITILSPRISTTHTAPELEKVFVHETIHMIFDTYAGNLEAPIWCAEGIATLYAEQVPLNCIDEQNYPRIINLLDEETFADNGGYDYSGVYVWYFIQRYGFAKFLKLYTNVPRMSELIYEGFEMEAICKIKKLFSNLLPQQEVLW